MNLRCLFRHKWDTHQHNFTTDDGATIVIAFKICLRCAASKLIHLLK
jgi:ligand-binding SRPBCC domain-containing protein